MSHDKPLSTVYATCTNPGPYSVEAAGATPVSGETIPRRHPQSREKLLVEPETGIATCYDILRRGARKFADAPALGTRKVVKIHSQDKQVPDGQGGTKTKKWSVPELSDYSYISYNELEQNALAIGSALRGVGLEKHDKIAIYAATSAFWLISAHGAISQSITIVTAYETLGEEGLTHSLRQTKAKTIFIDPDLLPRVTNSLEKASDITTVVYNDHNVAEPNENHFADFKSRHPKTQLIAYSSFLSQGRSKSYEPVAPTSDDLACIMYTSGSTGNPKGVLLKHRQVLGAVAGVGPNLAKYIGPGDRLLTYLPLAHIIEFVFENAGLFWGATLGFGSPRTLSSSNVKNCEGDMIAFRPSVMVGVPAVWETVKKGIVSKINDAGFVGKNLFWGALRFKEFLLGLGLTGPTGVLDSVVFGKIKQATGGNLKLVLNGGGAISEDTLKFISFAVCPMINGYGLTETSGMGGLVEPDGWTSKSNGGMPASIELKLVDVPDLNYFSSSDPPQGEVWIRGAAVTDGYFENPEENAKAFEEGWFKTGDIGEFTSTGQIKIIDRKKNLVKTLNGEYIALEKLETQYRSAPTVGSICVHASSEHVKPIAIVFPNEAVIRKLPGANSSAPFHELCDRSEVAKAVLKDVLQTGKQGGLEGIELVEHVVLTSEPWTAENGFLTNAQKLNRRAVVQHFDKEIKKAYSAK